METKKKTTPKPTLSPMEQILQQMGTLGTGQLEARPPEADVPVGVQQFAGGGWNPTDIVTKNPAAEGAGQLLKAKASEMGYGQRHLGIGGRPEGESQGNAWAQETQQGPQQRLAEMTNRTGAYAPTDARARLAAQAGGAPVHEVGTNLGHDVTLPSMSPSALRQTELTYAPRIPSPYYTHGLPDPVRGTVRAGAEDNPQQTSQSLHPASLAVNNSTPVGASPPTSVPPVQLPPNNSRVEEIKPNPRVGQAYPVNTSMIDYIRKTMPWLLPAESGQAVF